MVVDPFQAAPSKQKAAQIIKTRQENIKRLDIEVIATVDMLYGQKVLWSFLKTKEANFTQNSKICCIANEELYCGQ